MTLIYESALVATAMDKWMRHADWRDIEFVAQEYDLLLRVKLAEKVYDESHCRHRHCPCGR